MIQVVYRVRLRPDIEPNYGEYTETFVYSETSAKRLGAKLARAFALQHKTTAKHLRTLDGADSGWRRDAWVDKDGTALCTTGFDLIPKEES